MILALSKKEKIGDIPMRLDIEVLPADEPKEWKINKKKIFVPTAIDYKTNFLDRVREFQSGMTTETHSREAYENKLKKKEELKQKYCCDTIGEVQLHHTNYLDYLQKCWADHLGVVITPDVVWYTLLSEITLIVKGEAENFRHLFSNSKEKQDILVYSPDPVVMPLDTLIEALRKSVPTDADIFLPSFSTTTPRSTHAFSAAFCDMCSPYYNYMMYLCDIPLIDVRGTKEDWKFLSDKWQKMASLISEISGSASAWEVKVIKTLKDLIDNFESVDFWKSIFSIKRCGSGGQIEVSGWFLNFFKKQPSVKYVENYSPHISVVKYKQVNFNKDYEMLVGIFGSKKEGDLMVPDFSYIVNEV